MTYSVIIEVEGPFEEYGDGTFPSAADAIDEIKRGIEHGAYLSGDVATVVCNQTGAIVFSQTVE